MASGRLLERVVAAARRKRDTRYKRWHDSLSKEQLTDVLAIKAAHLAGDLGLSARSLAQAIIDDFDRQGIRVCSLHTLSQWLMQD